MGLLCSSSPLLQVAPSMSKGRPATELRCGEESRPPATRAVRYPLDRETGPWLAASVEETPLQGWSGGDEEDSEAAAGGLGSVEAGPAEETPLQGWSGGDEEDSEAAAGGLGSVEAGPATGLWGGEKWGMEALRLLKGPVEEGKQKLR
nr:hypothetical protein D5086_0000323570 [Populus alba]